MSTIQKFAIIPDEYKGMRLDQALADLWPEFSRSRISEWINSGAVSHNNSKKLKASMAVSGGETIFLNAEIKDEIDWKPENIALNIVYEDDDLLVINKPANCVVHPAAGHATGTLVNALLHHCPQLSTLPRAGIIHRLDKDTTGLLVIAKNLPSHNALVKAMQKRHIKRGYQAIVYGEMISGGTIDEPIARDPKNRQRMAIVHNGKPAITHYRIHKKFKDFTWLTIQLETGRTHQIRVHFAHKLHPIVGDQTYGRLRFPKQANNSLRDALKQFQRQALHAFQLTLNHPKTKEEHTWEAALPDDFLALASVFDKENR